MFIRSGSRYPFFVVLMLLLPLCSWAQNGKITGIVKDELNEGLPGVTVRTEDGSVGNVTQVNGSYQLSLPAGSYTIVFNYMGYNTKKITGVDVKAGDITDLSVSMVPSSLEEVVFTATFQQNSAEGLYHRQKNSAAISDGISAEQIRRTPDNTAAAALKRVSGLTIQDSKFVTVRGMSERYNNVMLNSSSLPSTEPNRRNFSFDILPSNLIDNIVVSKTATPDMPGEFAGGVVQVTTKDIPDENYTSLSLGTGYNTLSAGQPFQSLKRSNSEFIGKPGDDRDWWHGKFDDKAYGQYYREGDAAKLGEYSKKVPNNWGLYQYNYTPLQQYQLALGRLKQLKNNASIGLVGSLTYRHDEFRTEEDIKFRISDYRLRGTLYELNTTAAALLNMAYQNKNSKISFKNIYNKKLNHTTDVMSGDILSTSLVGNMYTDILTVNELYQNKFEGEHSVTKRRIKLGWSVDRSQLVRKQPDMRNSILVSNGYGLGEAQGTFDVATPGLSIMNAHLKEQRYNYSAYMQYPFKALGQDQKFKVGYQGMSRNADFLFNGLKLQYSKSSTIEDEISGRPDYFISQDQYIGQYGLYYRPAGPSFQNDPEGYNGKQNLHAAYAMVDMKLGKNFRFIGGGRVEDNTMTVTTTTYTFENDQIQVQEEKKKYHKTDILPSANLVYSLNTKMNLRAAYSKTLARPDFRERSSFLYYDFYEFTPYFGVTGLRDTRTDNIDLRYEYYPKSGEVISVSAFYKKFKDPVELIQQVTSGSNSAINFYFNLESSVNYGLEADWRKSLSFLNNGSKFLKNMYFSGNVSYMVSTVQYNVAELVAVASGLSGNVDTTVAESGSGDRRRALQGLSPYIINAGIGYQSNVLGVQLSYNRFGPRILTGAPFAWQDQYENTRDVLDVQFSAKLLKNKMDIRLNVSDILQQAFVVYQNAGTTADFQAVTENNNDEKGSNFNESKDVVRKKEFKGSNVSLSVSWQL